MPIIRFQSPPLPHFIACGHDTYVNGHTHPRRRSIGVFDLLFVTKGKLFIGEDNFEWALAAGNFLLLRPDACHFPTKPCEEETHFYWVHFSTVGDWCELDDYEAEEDFRRDPFERVQHFSIQLPKYSCISHPEQTVEKLLNLLTLENQPTAVSKWLQQKLFQEILMVMVTEQSTSFELPVKKVAEQAAAFIRQNYQASISYDQIGETLHFHPNYISRCMKKVFNCTPLEYLIRFRLEQAKLQLLKTDQTITEVAQTVGFEHIPYFTRCFTKHEGLTPSVFRKRFGVHIKNN